MLNINRLHIAFFALLCPLYLGAISQAGQPETYELVARGDAAAQRVQVITEIRGNLKLEASESGVDTLPLAVEAEMTYEERTLAWDETNRPAHTARHYHQAQAKIEVGSTNDTPELPEERRLVSVDLTGKSPLITSPVTPLTREELELIDLPASSALAPQLLPGRAVAIGDTWQHEESLLAALVGIDAITQAEVTSTLLEVEEDDARCEMTGHISGAADGVATQIELRGRYTYNLASGQITWLAVILQEDRSIGHATPGFEVTTRVRMLLAPLPEPVVLTDETIAAIPTAADPGQDLLTYRSAEGGFLVMHDRRWRVMVDNSTLSVLRLVDRGELVAQCNIVRLPNVPAGQQLSVEEFTGEVRQALGEKCQEIVEAYDEVTADGLHVIRILAAGEVQGMPIHWIYYHMGDREGRRAACVFTLEAERTESFAAADIALTSSLRFLAGVETGAPQEATEAGAEPASVAPAPPETDEVLPAEEETAAAASVLEEGPSLEVPAERPATPERTARRILDLRR